MKNGAKATSVLDCCGHAQRNDCGVSDCDGHNLGCKNSSRNQSGTGVTEDDAWLIAHARVVALELSDRLFSFGMEQRPFAKKAALVMNAQADEIERLRAENEMLKVRIANEADRAEAYRVGSGKCTGGT